MNQANCKHGQSYVKFTSINMIDCFDRMIDQSNNQSISQSDNRSINQSINQSTNHPTINLSKEF